MTNCQTLPAFSFKVFEVSQQLKNAVIIYNLCTCLIFLCTSQLYLLLSGFKTIQTQSQTFANAYKCIKSKKTISPAFLLHAVLLLLLLLLLTAPLPGCLTGLSDVDQAQQVHQFEEHDHQADDANCLQSFRLPPHAHLPLVFLLFLHDPSLCFPLLLHSWTFYPPFYQSISLFQASLSLLAFFTASSLWNSVTRSSLLFCHNFFPPAATQFSSSLLFFVNWLMDLSRRSPQLRAVSDSQTPLLRSTGSDYCSRNTSKKKKKKRVRKKSRPRH